jgi:CheY-like chemotaxis protein
MIFMTGEQWIILIVVDEAIDCELLREHLGSGGDTVREAESGLEALQKAERATDLILLNSIMPGWDDLGVCRCLRANETFHDIPVIILSSSRASGRAEILRQALSRLGTAGARRRS